MPLSHSMPKGYLSKENFTCLKEQIMYIGLSLALIIIAKTPFGSSMVDIRIYTTLTNFSTKYLVMCKVYTDVGGIK